MERTKRTSLIVVISAAVVLLGMLWMPIFFAGPDGLERVLFNITGNEEYEPETDVVINSPFPDYLIPNWENEYLNAWVSGIIGMLLVFLVMFGMFKLLKLMGKGKKQTRSPDSDTNS